MQQTAVYGVGDVSYQSAGGIEGLRRLVADFYRLMDELPEARALRQLHGESLTLASYLASSTAPLPSPAFTPSGQ